MFSVAPTPLKKKNLAREDTRLPFLLKELLGQNENFVTKVSRVSCRDFGVGVDPWGGDKDLMGGIRA